MVEGMLAEALSEIKAATDVLWNHVDEPDKYAKATFVIIWAHVQDILSRLEPYSDSSLRLKHAMCRDIVLAMQDRMEDNNPNEDGDEFDLAIFASDVTSFLTAFHICLHDGTNQKKRKAEYKEFCHG